MNANLALTGVIPGIVAMWYVDRLDAKRPEPARLRRWVAVLGALSVIPAVMLGSLLESTVGERIGPAFTYNGAFYRAFILAAIVEEACKIAVVYWLVWRRPEFDERMDGIVYATRAGLGFAMVENFFYLLNEKAVDSFVTTWILRAILAVPGHAMWTGMIGALAARRRFDGKGIGLLGGFLLAVLFHGAYDACIFLGTPLTMEGQGALATVLLGGPLLLTVAAALLMRRLSKAAAHLDDQDAVIRERAAQHAAPTWPQAVAAMPAHSPYGPPQQHQYPPYPPAPPPGAAPSPYAPPQHQYPPAPPAAPSPYAPPQHQPYPPAAAPSPYAPPQHQYPPAPPAAPSPYAPPQHQHYPPAAAPSPYAQQPQHQYPPDPPAAPSPYAPPQHQYPPAPPAAPSPYAPPQHQYPPAPPAAPSPYAPPPQPSPYPPSPPPGAAPYPPAPPPPAAPSPYAPPAPWPPPGRGPSSDGSKP